MGKHKVIFHHALNIQSKKNIFPEAWFLGRLKGDKPICQPCSKLAYISVASISQMSPLQNYLLHLCFIKLPTTKEKEQFL